MADVTVVQSDEVELRPGSVPGLGVRPTLGPQTGFSVLQQAVLECEPGRTDPILVTEVEETMFVISGGGTVHLEGRAHAVESEVGIYIAPGSQFALENPGPETLRLVAVRVPDPVPESRSGVRAAVTTLADQELERASAQREFRVVADPASGLRSATHFVGYIFPARAPDHFHTYDEVIYVLDGHGVMHASGFEQSLRPGSCIQLPARTVHCVENTGEEPMRVVAVFRPPGSPAAAFYSDGTPAYQG